LSYTLEFVQRFPDQEFVINHLAKPDFKQNNFLDWEKGITAIAKCENVYCKVSGLITEADWNNWNETDFTYCLDVVTVLLESIVCYLAATVQFVCWHPITIKQ
jgi:L-fuconolactonase